MTFFFIKLSFSSREFSVRVYNEYLAKMAATVPITADEERDDARSWIINNGYHQDPN
jgi:hypothetical protein